MYSIPNIDYGILKESELKKESTAKNILLKSIKNYENNIITFVDNKRSKEEIFKNYNLFQEDVTRLKNEHKEDYDTSIVENALEAGGYSF